jgi:PAS domain S-box-containing protein
LVDAAHFVCNLLGPAPFGIMVLSTTGHCIGANATLGVLARQTLDADRLEGLQIQFEPDFRDAFAKALRGQVAVVESDAPPPIGAGQGTWRVHFLPFVTPEMLGVALLFEDVTEPRLAAEAFQAAEQRFRLLVDSAADGLVIYRAQVLLYVNPEAVRQLGYLSSDDLVGRSLSELIAPEHRSNFDRLLPNAEGGSASGLFETAFLRRDGSSFPAECRASRTRVDEMGAGFLFFRDIAERKRLQARRENARRVDTLARMSTSLGSELHGYVNELRRLLAPLRPGTPKESLGELTTLIDEMAHRAERLSVLRPVSSEPPPSVTLEELMSRVCAKLAPTPDAVNPAPETRSPLLVDLEPEPHAVSGNAVELEFGLSVLAQIALGSRPNDNPLRVRGARVAAQGAESRSTYVLSFATGKARYCPTTPCHSGSSFPPSAWAFGSWERGGDLELLGALAALQSQGCWIEVQQCAGGGLSFDVELSLELGCSRGSEFEDRSAHLMESDDEADRLQFTESDDGVPDTRRSQNPAGPISERSRLPVLICDDEPRLVALTAGLLREFGFEVMTVRSGVEAVRAVMNNPIDIVILDVNLPGEDARAIVAQLHAQGEISIILSSGYTEEDIEPELLQHGAVKAFLAKPYGVETLVETIDVVRQKARAQASGSVGER